MTKLRTLVIQRGLSIACVAITALLGCSERAQPHDLSHQEFASNSAAGPTQGVVVIFVEGPDGVFECVGASISDETIVTSSRCLGEDPHVIDVVFAGDPARHPVTAYALHPDADSQDSSAHLALLRLQTRTAHAPISPAPDVVASSPATLVQSRGGRLVASNAGTLREVGRGLVTSDAVVGSASLGSVLIGHSCDQPLLAGIMVDASSTPVLWSAMDHPSTLAWIRDQAIEWTRDPADVGRVHPTWFDPSGRFAPPAGLLVALSDELNPARGGRRPRCMIVGNCQDVSDALADILRWPVDAAPGMRPVGPIRTGRTHRVLRGQGRIRNIYSGPPSIAVREMAGEGATGWIGAQEYMGDIQSNHVMTFVVDLTGALTLIDGQRGGRMVTDPREIDAAFPVPSSVLAYVEPTR